MEKFPIHGSCSQPSTPRHAPNVSKGSPLQQGSSSSATSSPGRGSTSSSEQAGKTNRFSKFFTSLKNLIAEAANIEPTSDVAPGVDHCCKTSRCHYGLPIHHLDSEWLAFGSQCASSSATSSSTLFPQVTSRLIVYRDCDRRGRRILFDSEHVSSDYVYLKPEDPKLLKQLGEYVFGCVPLASTASSLSLDCGVSSGHKRFCKWKVDGKFEQPNKTLYIWSQIFEMGSYNRSTKKDSTAASDYSLSASDQSSSGYESGGKTFSLPLFNQRLSSSPSNSESSFSQTRSLPGRIDNYKTNLALVWILSQNDSEPGTSEGTNNSQAKIPFPYLSPLVEKMLLNPLSHLTQSFYRNSNHFASSLKNVSTSLGHDLQDFLSNHHVVNLTLVKPPLPDMVNAKLVTRFLELFFTNLDSCVVINLKKWTEVKAILYFFKMVLRTCVCKCNLLDSRRDSLVETGTDIVSVTTVHELDGVDSGIELEGSSSTRIHSVSTSSMYQSGRKWSIVSEEGSDLGGEESSQDEGDCGRVSFHLGDVDVDQSEAKLALGEVDLNRLKRDERRPSIESTASSEVHGPDYIPPDPNRPPVEVKLSLSDGKLKDTCSAKYTPCYHCNGTYITEHSRFNPYYYCQVLAKPGQDVIYSMEYVNFMKIIELYGSGQTRHFNLSDEKATPVSSSSTFSLNTEDIDANDLSKKIKQFVDGYIQLAKVTNDSGKLDSFVTFQMEEIQEYIL